MSWCQALCVATLLLLSSCSTGLTDVRKNPVLNFVSLGHGRLMYDLRTSEGEVVGLKIAPGTIEDPRGHKADETCLLPPGEVTEYLESLVGRAKIGEYVGYDMVSILSKGQISTKNWFFSNSVAQLDYVNTANGSPAVESIELYFFREVVFENAECKIVATANPAGDVVEIFLGPGHGEYYALGGPSTCDSVKEGKTVVAGGPVGVWYPSP